MSHRVAVVIVVSMDGRLLGVSRPEPPLRFGFPGGGVEPGETFEQGARRELWEETGLVADQLCPVLHATVPSGHEVRCFFEMGAPRGQIRSSHEGLTRWLPAQHFVDRGTGAFPAYAMQAFKMLGVLGLA